MSFSKRARQEEIIDPKWKPFRHLHNYAYSAGAVIAATAVRRLLEPKVGPYTPTLPFLVAVLLSARFWGLGPSLAATLLSALSYAYFFMEAASPFSIADPSEVGTIIEFVVVCLIIVFQTNRLKLELIGTKDREAMLHRQMQLIDLSHDAIVTLDKNRSINTWNQGAVELYGWSAQEAAGQRIEAFLRSQNHLPIGEVTRILARDGRWEGELTQVHRDGRAVVTESRQILVRDGGGAVSGILEINRDITDRKHAEETLRVSEQRLRTIFEHAPTGIATADGDGRLEHCNPAFCSLLGRPETELRGRWFGDLIPPEDRDASVSMFEQLRAGRIPFYELESRYLRTDGEPVWTHKFVSSLPDEQGRPKVLVMVSDITDRKRAEEAQQERERTLLRFTESAPVAIAMFDNKMRYLAISRRYCEDFHLDVQDLLGRSHYEVFPEIPERWRGAHRRCLAGATERCNSEPWTRCDGSEQWIRWEIQPWRHANGAIGGIVLFTENITEQKRTYDALQQALEQREVANDAAQLGTWDYHFNTGQVFWDERCRKMFGICENGQDYYDAVIARIHEDRRADVDQAVQRALAGVDDGAYHQEYRVIWPDGAVHWVASHGRAYFEGVNGQRRPIRFVGVNMDITERKQAEEEILRLNATLERRVEERTAQLLEANRELEAFSYSVSHDLRAPLRGIDGWSLALLEDHGNQLDADAREQLDRVRSEAQHMGRLIDDLLQLSRITRRELQSDQVDFTELAKSVAARLIEQNPERRIEISVQPEMTAHGDAGLLEVVLTNLLGNAVKFTAPRELARIEVGCGTQADPAFFVRDNGVGFDMNYAGKLFGPFQRLHKTSEFPGTGIGLATVERVIRRHGGRVWAEARVGLGATFYFRLEEPYAREDHSVSGRQSQRHRADPACV